MTLEEKVRKIYDKIGCIELVPNDEGIEASTWTEKVTNIISATGPTVEAAIDSLLEKIGEKQ